MNPASQHQTEFRRLVREVWQNLQQAHVGTSFTNVEGGGVEQQRDRRLQLHHCANYAAVLELLEDKGPKLRILELGCGTGALSSAFARLMPKGWQLTATDYSGRLIEHARAHYRQENLSFEQLDVLAVQAGQLAQFDVVLFLEVIEHLPQTRAADLLKKLHAGLKPGASLVLSTLDRTPFPRPFSGYAPHFIEYTYESLAAFLAGPAKSPFERFQVMRLVSARVAGEAVRAEQRGGYLANRVQRFALDLARRSPAFRRLHGLVTAVAFRLYSQLPRSEPFDLEGYLGSLEFVRQAPETGGRSSLSCQTAHCAAGRHVHQIHSPDSFGLIAVLEKR